MGAAVSIQAPLLQIQVPAPVHPRKGAGGASTTWSPATSVGRPEWSPRPLGFGGQLGPLANVSIFGVTKQMVSLSLWCLSLFNEMEHSYIRVFLLLEL